MGNFDFSIRQKNNTIHAVYLGVAITLCLPNLVLAKKNQSTQGLLPELSGTLSGDEKGEKLTAQSEALIAKTEEKAILALKNLIQKKKGTATEADLWFRLSELYLRRAKSGRYFDLQKQNQKNETSAAAKELRNAIDIYIKIEKQFPKFISMDAVLFNWAFAAGQIGQSLKSEELYKKMIKEYSSSELIPDAHMALGEIYYNRGNFNSALVEFKALEQFASHKNYPYSLYKQAWSLYNLKRNGEAISKLEQVMQLKSAHNLRPEALRDLGLFFGETYKAADAYDFFYRLAKDNELSDAMISLGKLYSSHSRYDELQIFLKDFIEKQPNAIGRVQAQILILQSQEEQKKRELVTQTMREAAATCHPQSIWRSKNISIAKQMCDEDLAKAHLEITKKWWDLWNKNKANKEIAKLTTEAFEIHLDREDTSAPDIKSRYAFAELLYQQKKYREASVQYKKTSDTVYIQEKMKEKEPTRDKAVTQIGHDSNYSALVALESAIEIEGKKADPTTDDIKELMILCESYRERYPNGSQIEQVNYKYGFTAYLKKDFQLSLSTLEPLAKNKTQDPSISLRSQDIVLDILNIQKNLKKLSKFADEYISRSIDTERTKKLTLIRRQTDLALIQNDIESAATVENIKKLERFAQSNSGDTLLSTQALNQAMNLYYGHDQKFNGARVALEVTKKNKVLSEDDKKIIPALKESIQVFYEFGFFNLAAEAMLELSKRQPESDKRKTKIALAEIYRLEKNAPLLQQILRELLKDSHSIEETANNYLQLLESTEFENSNLKKILVEKEIRDKNIQPLVAQYELNQIQIKLDEKKYSEVFEKSKKFVGGQYPEDIRARARFMQAQVLEQEMIAQSTKTDLSRLTTVLSLKTEKLDKAQTGYLAAASYSKNPLLQKNVLLALDRLYLDYIDRIKNIEIKDKLSPAEKNELQSELSKLIEPIQKKQAENRKKILAISVGGTELPSETEAFSAPTGEINSRMLAFAYPIIKKEDSLDLMIQQEPNAANCNFNKNNETSIRALLENINACFSKQGPKISEDQSKNLLEQIAILSATSGLAPYYLSEISMRNKHFDKALTLINLAIKRSTFSSLFLYQKARILQHIPQFENLASEAILKAYDLGLNTTGAHLLYAGEQYKKGNCLSSLQALEKVEVSDRIDSYADLIHAECLAQSGQSSQATDILTKSILRLKSSANEKSNHLTTVHMARVELEWARILENFLHDPDQALKQYELAAQKLPATMKEAEWVTKKILWIKNNKKLASPN